MINDCNARLYKGVCFPQNDILNEIQPNVKAIMLIAYKERETDNNITKWVNNINVDLLFCISLLNAIIRV